MKRTLQTIFLSLFVLSQLLLPLVQAEAFQLAAQIETTTMGANDQIEQAPASVVPSLVGARLATYLPQPSAVTYTFPCVFALVNVTSSPPHTPVHYIHVTA